MWAGAASRFFWDALIGDHFFKGSGKMVLAVHPLTILETVGCMCYAPIGATC